jgi:hypothetical protein
MMGHFFHIGCDIVELPQIIGGNSMKKLFAIILVLTCCLSLVACSLGEPTQTTQPSQTQESTDPATSGISPAVTESAQSTQPVVTHPQQNLCYWCDEVPVGDFETYCVNCRCLKCDRLRKSGGSYLYCSDHNCNESGCDYPAFEDSQYCTEHKCSKPDCENRRWSGSEYCAHHK